MAEIASGSISRCKTIDGKSKERCSNRLIFVQMFAGTCGRSGVEGCLGIGFDKRAVASQLSSDRRAEAESITHNHQLDERPIDYFVSPV